METIDIQQNFFRHIKSILPTNLSFVDDVSELLNISNDSAYRRIRGEKPITLDEIQKLCKHYRISLDQIMNLDAESTVFYGKNVDAVNFNFECYLKDMLQNLKMISGASNKRMYYEACDIPIFHHFQFAELAAFKYFFWMKSVLYYPEYSKMTYEDSKLTEILLTLGKEITKVYNQIPSAEIWVIESINTTLRQIEYYTYAGVIKKKETIATLYEQLEQLIDHIKEQAEHGEKFLIGEKPTGTANNFQLYFNEVYLGHNSIMAETDGVQTAFINHAVLNYMMTHDKVFCDYTKQSLENNMKKSVLISSVGEKERSRFFNILTKSIERSKKETL